MEDMYYCTYKVFKSGEGIQAAAAAIEYETRKTVCN
jgi:hypothetical protein